MSAESHGWAETLDLEADELARVGWRTWQWAGALKRRESKRDAAALYRLAAGYALLLDGGARREICTDAAAFLRSLPDTYCNVLAVCAGTRHPEQWAFVPRPDETLAPQSRGHALTLLAWAAVIGDDEARGLLSAHREAAEAVAPLPANRLRMPLRVTAAVVVAAVRDAMDALYQAVDELLSRTDDVYGAAMLDRYHWRRMLSRVMPAEPEIIAPLAVAVAAGYAPEEGRDRHGPPARVALEVASRIAQDAE